MLTKCPKPRRLTPAQATATAYHEAGHAVVAHYLGQSVGRKGISIVPDAETSGRVHLPLALTNAMETRPTGRMRSLAEDRAVVWLAGLEAQRKYRSRSVRNYHASQDYENAVDIISYICGSPEELEPYLRLLQARAKAILHLPMIWESIERVASALLEHKQLSRAELMELIH